MILENIPLTSIFSIIDVLCGWCVL